MCRLTTQVMYSVTWETFLSWSVSHSLIRFVRDKKKREWEAQYSEEAMKWWWLFNRRLRRNGKHEKTTFHFQLLLQSMMQDLPNYSLGSKRGKVKEWWWWYCRVIFGNLYETLMSCSLVFEHHNFWSDWAERRKRKWSFLRRERERSAFRVSFL